MEKPIVFSDHALERGLQVGLDERQLYDCFAVAQRVSVEEREKLSRNHQGEGMRYYRSGGNVFVVRNLKDKMIVVTIYDDVFLRNENYKIKHRREMDPRIEEVITA